MNNLRLFEIRQKLTNAANPESVGARPRAGASLVGTLGTENAKKWLTDETKLIKVNRCQ